MIETYGKQSLKQRVIYDCKHLFKTDKNAQTVCSNLGIEAYTPKISKCRIILSSFILLLAVATIPVPFPTTTPLVCASLYTLKGGKIKLRK